LGEAVFNLLIMELLTINIKRIDDIILCQYQFLAAGAADDGDVQGFLQACRCCLPLFVKLAVVEQADQAITFLVA
jgi:hypothetical protein